MSKRTPSSAAVVPRARKGTESGVERGKAVAPSSAPKTKGKRSNTVGASGRRDSATMNTSGLSVEASSPVLARSPSSAALTGSPRGAAGPLSPSSSRAPRDERLGSSTRGQPTTPTGSLRRAASSTFSGRGGAGQRLAGEQSTAIIGHGSNGGHRGEEAVPSGGSRSMLTSPLASKAPPSSTGVGAGDAPSSASSPRVRGGGIAAQPRTPTLTSPPSFSARRDLSRDYTAGDERASLFALINAPHPHGQLSSSSHSHSHSHSHISHHHLSQPRGSPQLAVSGVAAGSPRANPHQKDERTVPLSRSHSLRATFSAGSPPSFSAQPHSPSQQHQPLSVASPLASAAPAVRRGSSIGPSTRHLSASQRPTPQAQTQSQGQSHQSPVPSPIDLLSHSLGSHPTASPHSHHDNNNSITKGSSASSKERERERGAASGVLSLNPYPAASVSAQHVSPTPSMAAGARRHHQQLSSGGFNSSSSLRSGGGDTEGHPYPPIPPHATAAVAGAQHHHRDGASVGVGVGGGRTAVSSQQHQFEGASSSAAAAAAAAAVLGRRGSSSARGRLEGALRTARGGSEEPREHEATDGGRHHFVGISAVYSDDGGSSSSGTSSDGVGDGDATPSSRRVRRLRQRRTGAGGGSRSSSNSYSRRSGGLAGGGGVANGDAEGDDGNGRELEGSLAAARASIERLLGNSASSSPAHQRQQPRAPHAPSASSPHQQVADSPSYAPHGVSGANRGKTGSVSRVAPGPSASSSFASSPPTRDGSPPPLVGGDELLQDGGIAGSSWSKEAFLAARPPPALERTTALAPPSAYRPPQHCRFGGFAASHETARQTLARLGPVSPHVRAAVQFCRARLPLFAFFQLVETLIPLSEGSARGGDACMYTYAFHWAPRNDLLARGLQMFEAMGYRQTVFAHAFAQLTHSTAGGAEAGVFPVTPRAFFEVFAGEAADGTEVPVAVPTTAMSPSAGAHALGASSDAPPSLPPTRAEAFGLCATLLDMFAPDAPTPALFSNRAQLLGTAGVVPSGTRRPYQRQRDLAAAEQTYADSGTFEGKDGVNGSPPPRRVHCVSSHSSLEASPTALGGAGAHPSPQGAASLPTPFTSCDVTPFLTAAEGHRWLSEQEYVIAALLFSIAGVRGPAAGVEGKNTGPSSSSLGPTHVGADGGSSGSGGGLRSSPYSSPQQSSDCTFDSFLLREVGFTSRSGPALCAAVDALVLGPNNCSAAAAHLSLGVGAGSSGRTRAPSEPPLSVGELDELLMHLLSSHPLVYVALKAAPAPSPEAGGGGGGDYGGAASADFFARSEAASSFSEAWSRQAITMFVATCPRHNHVLAFGGSSGGGGGGGGYPPPGGTVSPLPAPFAHIPYEETSARWRTLFSIGCPREAARWIAEGDAQAVPPPASTAAQPSLRFGPSSSSQQQQSTNGGGGAANHPPVPFDWFAYAPQCVVTSDVECGSIAPYADRYDALPTMAVPSPAPVFLFRGCGDTADTDCKKVWFRFAFKGACYGAPASNGSASGLGASNTVTFRAMNMAPHGRLYRSGMRPVCRFGAPLHAVTGRGRRNAQWRLVDSCGFVPVRGDEEAEISFSVALPPAGGGAWAGSAKDEPHSPVSFSCRRCLLAAPEGSEGKCVQCRLKTWLLVGVPAGPAVATASQSAPHRQRPPMPPALQPTIHISFIEPYSYGSLLSHIALWHSIVKRSPSNIRFEERVLCTSVDGRKLHLLIVTSLSDASARQAAVADLQQSSGPATAFGSRRSASAGRSRRSNSSAPSGGASGAGVHLPPGPAGWMHLLELQGFYSHGTAPPPLVGDFSSGKKVVLLSGRVHPSEVSGSYALHGLVQFLLSPDPRAAQLRENFIFFIVPMLNPDGVSRGHNRQDQYGDNLNRCYNNPSPDTQPTVLALKNVFEFLQQHYKGDRFVMYLDFHSHASQLLGFAFGNCLSAPLQPWNMLFPRLIEAHSNGLFSAGGSKFAKNHMSSKDGTSRVLFGQTLMHSYTMELSHFAHLLWSPSQGLVGGGICAVSGPSAALTSASSSSSPLPPPANVNGLISFGAALPHPHEGWESYTRSPFLLDETGAAHSAIQPWFVILRQSAEVGRACATALLDYCGIGSPPPAASAANATPASPSSPSAGPQRRGGAAASAMAQMGRPSECLTKAGGMDRLVREARQLAMKTLQPQQGGGAGGGGGNGGGNGAKGSRSNAGAGARPTWNGF